MLEITGEHVGKLDDTDLRILVTRLCEAELRRCGLPLSAITAGGDQNAPDGGIDPCAASLHRYFETGVPVPSLPNLVAWYERLADRPAYRKRIMTSFEGLRGRLTF